MNTLQLRLLTNDDEQSFRSAVSEFEKETPPWGFAFDFAPQENFASYVTRVNDWSLGIGVPNEFVTNSYLVGIVDGRIVGRLSLRHTLNDFLQKYGGHIGYGVIPSERRKGYASEMLRQALPLCAKLGIQRALVSCDTDNDASRRVIENNGGVFDSITNLPDLAKQKRLYWIYPNKQK